MLTLFSPAKINLFLRILHRRPDGYHELASLMQTVGLCDKISIQISDCDRFTCSDSTLTTDHSNLVIKARDLFRKKTGFQVPVAIHLEKRIPLQAGLGGGSSNAATALWGINQLSGQIATENQLRTWSGELGSDVPFFFSRGLAYCTGRGEIIQDCPPINKGTVSIVKPKCSLSTPLVYKNLNLNLLSQNDPQSILQAFFQEKPCFINDLEQPAFALVPELAHLKKSLESSGFTHVLMSGSGSSFFCLGSGNIDDQLVSEYGLQSHSVPFVHRTGDGWFN